MASFKRKLKGKEPPEGWHLIEGAVEDFETQMKEAVNEEHDGKRKSELSWKIHRIHWEKNRFIYDLMYQRKVLPRILYDYLVREKIADGALISKWRKPGYEILCSLLAIQKNNHNFGTTSHCRVPLHQRSRQQRITPDVQTGCISCASGDGRFGQPVWWNTPIADDGQEEKHKTGWQQDVQVNNNKQYANVVDNGARKGNYDQSIGKKRALEDGEDNDLPDEVQKRLNTLKQSK